MLGVRVLALATVISCALCRTRVDRRAVNHGLEAFSDYLSEASIKRRGSVDETTMVLSQGSGSYDVVAPLCNVTQCADPNLNDPSNPRKRKRPDSTSSDTLDAAPPPAQMARPGPSGDSNSGSASELADAGPYPWSKLSVPGKGKKSKSHPQRLILPARTLPEASAYICIPSESSLSCRETVGDPPTLLFLDKSLAIPT